MRLREIALLALGSLALSCTNDLTAVEPTVLPSQSVEPSVYQLNLDSPLSLDRIAVSWLDLSDSRCPSGLTCVWEGEAIATIETSRDSMAPERIELTLRPGTTPTAVTAVGHVFRLLKVAPYPVEGVTPARDEYVASIEILPL